MNEALFNGYSALPAWTALFDRLSGDACLSLSGMTEGEKPFFAAALAHAAKRPVLLIAPTELVAKRQAQDIRRLGLSAAVLPSRDVQFSRAASSRESTWQRLQVLEDAIRGRLQVLCVSADAALDRCLNAQAFRSATIQLKEGGRIAPAELIDRLLKLGYERVAMVEGCGQCAMRGAILDVFAPTELDALRIEFFDDEIDSIRRFDPISQRSIERVKEARITPASECILSDFEAAARRFEAAIRERAAAAAAPEPHNRTGWIPWTISFRPSTLRKPPRNWPRPRCWTTADKPEAALPPEAPSGRRGNASRRATPSAPRRCG